MDQDYINQLDDSGKEWLSQFNNEYYGNTLNKDWRKNLHHKETKKTIYDATNARNRDMYNNRYKYNENESGIAVPSSLSEFTNPEDANIEYIDLKRKIAKFISDAKKSGLKDKEIEQLVIITFNID